MLHYVPCPQIDRLLAKPNFTGWGLSKATVALLSSNPNAFLLGGVFDRLIDANKAWECPRLVADRLGHLNVRRIAGMRVEKLAAIIGRQPNAPSLHRFPRTMARCAISACRRLLADYGGNAANIWAGDPGALEVLRRLDEFEGISQKIANMMVRLLITYYGVRLSGWKDVDVAVDRHVARVFLRTGLLRPSARTTRHSVAGLRDEIVSKARALSPKYPGALDEPAFVIGKDWCTAEEAYCDAPASEGGPCPLRSVCRQDRLDWQV